MEILIGTMMLAAVVVVVFGLFTACAAVFRAVARSNVTTRFEQYNHHNDSLVWVRSSLRGRHGEHCLCFSCEKFHPGTKRNCAIAQKLFYFCIEHDLVTPMWECPAFAQDVFAIR